MRVKYSEIKVWFGFSKLCKIPNLEMILRNQNYSFWSQLVNQLRRCLKNVIIGNSFQDSKLKHIVIFVRKIFCRFWCFLHWIHFPRIDCKAFWNCNCDFFVVDGWELRDLNHTIGDISISFKTVNKLYFGWFWKNLRWTPLIEFLKHRLTFGRAQMFLFPLQPDALKIFFRISFTLPANQRAMIISQLIRILDS